MGLAAIARGAVQYFNNRLFDLAIIFLLRMVEWYTHQLVISIGQIQDNLRSTYHDAREQLLECLSGLVNGFETPYVCNMVIKDLWVVIRGEMKKFEEAVEVEEAILNRGTRNCPSRCCS
jgi:hypothetical protein